VQHERKRHEKRWHQNERKTRRELGRWRRLKDLQWPGTCHDAEADSHNQIHEAEQIEDNGALNGI
jgi:hypothetical protein